MRKADKAVLRTIADGNTNEFIELASSLKSIEDVVYIPFLLDRFEADSNIEIRNRIIELVSNLRVQEAVPFVMDYIRLKRENYRDLYETCWESELDYSAYFEQWTQLFCDEDLEHAIELFTVIEEIYNRSNWIERQNVISRLKELKLSDTKLKLVHQFISENKSDKLEMDSK